MLKEFKNGNIHLKLEKDDVGIDTIEKLYFNYDLHPESEEYCISNYATACDWCYNGGYNYYTITSYDLQDLENGKAVILQPLPDEYIKEYILNDMEE